MMEMMIDLTSATDIVGMIASIALICGYLPQAIYTIRTRDTDGISLTGFILITVGGVGFCINGILTGNVPLWITNGITSISSFIVFFIKMRNDYWKKK